MRDTKLGPLWRLFGGSPSNGQGYNLNFRMTDVCERDGRTSNLQKYIARLGASHFDHTHSKHNGKIVDSVVVRTVKSNMRLGRVLIQSSINTFRDSLYHKGCIVCLSLGSHKA